MIDENAHWMKYGVPIAHQIVMEFGRLNGTGCVKCGHRDLGAIDYHVEVGAGGQASVVKFERRPQAKGGDHLHLTLEDGRMLDCEVLDASPYCAVVGDGPYHDRRALQR
jgi:hypothetical protein